MYFDVCIGVNQGKHVPAHNWRPNALVESPKHGRFENIFLCFGFVKDVCPEQNLISKTNPEPKTFGRFGRMELNRILGVWQASEV